MRNSGGLYPHGQDWRRQIHSKVACPEGLTMGRLYDFVEEWIQMAKLTYSEFVPESRRRRMGSEHSITEPERPWERNEWGRKELYVCDKNSGQLLFLHLDLDRYSLAKA